MMLLEQLPIDLVEIVITKSDSYELFKEMQILLPKLQEMQRVSRIKDKMTKIFIHKHSIKYYLYGNKHREYNKPAIVYYEPSGYYDTIYEFVYEGVYKRDIGYSEVRICVRTNHIEKNYKHIIYLDSYYNMCSSAIGRIDKYLK